MNGNMENFSDLIQKFHKCNDFTIIDKKIYYWFINALCCNSS